MSSSNQRNSRDHGNTDSIQSAPTITARKRGEELPNEWKLPTSRPARHDASSNASHDDWIQRAWLRGDRTSLMLVRRMWNISGTVVKLVKGRWLSNSQKKKKKTRVGLYAWQANTRSFLSFTVGFRVCSVTINNSDVPLHVVTISHFRFTNGELKWIIVDTACSGKSQILTVTERTLIRLTGLPLLSLFWSLLSAWPAPNNSPDHPNPAFHLKRLHKSVHECA